MENGQLTMENGQLTIKILKSLSIIHCQLHRFHLAHRLASGFHCRYVLDDDAPFPVLVAQVTIARMPLDVGQEAVEGRTLVIWAVRIGHQVEAHLPALHYDLFHTQMAGHAAKADVVD